MNLLILSVDSLRWDAAARCGATPRFSAAVDGMTATDRCFSVSTATRPVHQSVFSGLYPFEHGITGQHVRSRRRGIPRLFESLRRAGYRTGAFSEAASILGGVDLGQTVNELSPDAATGLGGLSRWLEVPHTRCALFVHYWSTHTPYGAADGKALGETARLIRDGQTDTVVSRYLAAVRACLEQKIAPLLSRLDRSRWTIVLFGDHGERWTEQELFHGRTLHHDVLRVPLWLHVPYQRVEPGALCSLIDLDPTLRSLLHLEPSLGAGRDLLSASTSACYLAQIEPTADPTDDAAPLLGMDEAERTVAGAGQWAVFDERHKATWDERAAHDRSGPVRWCNPFDPEETPCDPGRFDPTTERDRIAARSKVTGEGMEDGIGAQALTARLKDLGYLD